jgi:hypothetical protein
MVDDSKQRASMSGVGLLAFLAGAFTAFKMPNIRFAQVGRNSWGAHGRNRGGTKGTKGAFGNPNDKGVRI